MAISCIAVTPMCLNYLPDYYSFSNFVASDNNIISSFLFGEIAFDVQESSL